jgi:hypothetical protein
LPVCYAGSVSKPSGFVLGICGFTGASLPFVGRRDLVNVTATVIDESGKYVDGLSADDFRVLEDGQEQKISFFSHDSHLPISLGVLIDKISAG